ncbi:MinD superfamily P-loop ATPase, contains an inserted ferredoxin domain [Desulfonispora thiosulfatigenes DSM 11270]|uniref:MinD superfamily P-loop ATPase, contains an inserted ferredoxin domain n=1 Tax=Desulfonispora thiosulfatigenes DSM 11270 TaxID=656914 RepID=A0A1W1V4R7_DESTI|nr:ATP-binding protein [Desulfonispora thiosulfatigenes]SMB88031.1 MinD superfamily P-loop ATPase, contains an inserted ferredoxin domain [Desulfonispora thiosulfatigenes DSM 11270]
MKELVVISGKGGTGKTSLASSLAALAKKHVMVDCDVDAADLHLVLKPNVLESHDYYGGKKAVINYDLCVKCGKCPEVCRFDAINENIEISSLACEGCGACAYICPEKAIKLEDSLSGQWFISDTEYAPMVHARLGIAEDNSGKLVSLIRAKAREIAGKDERDLLIIDGSPGIGCPVIASITGADLVLIVVEPTLSGKHDLERVIGLTKHFHVNAAVVINKFDLNEEMSDEIMKYCKDNDLNFLTKLSYDETVVKAQIAKKPVISFPDAKISSEIKLLFAETLNLLNK